VIPLPELSSFRGRNLGPPYLPTKLSAFPTVQGLPLSIPTPWTERFQLFLGFSPSLPPVFSGFHRRACAFRPRTSLLTGSCDGALFFLFLTFSSRITLRFLVPFIDSQFFSSSTRSLRLPTRNLMLSCVVDLFFFFFLDTPPDGKSASRSPLSCSGCPPVFFARFFEPLGHLRDESPETNIGATYCVSQNLYTTDTAELSPSCVLFFFFVFVYRHDIPLGSLTPTPLADPWRSYSLFSVFPASCSSL